MSVASLKPFDYYRRRFFCGTIRSFVKKKSAIEKEAAFMKYISTRGDGGEIGFSDTVLTGLAPDRGLYVPANLPVFADTWFEHMQNRSYVAIVHQLLATLANDLPNDSLLKSVRETYTPEVFGNVTDGDNPKDIVPVRPMCDGQYYLVRLSNGPTLAFKDVALQLLGRFFEIVLKGNGLNVLGATSGDTGSAAIHAMLNREGIRVFMLAPRVGMSPFQAAQMWSVNNPMIHNIAINGSFDDCQRIVKAVFDDAEYKREQRLGAVNSINWARIAAQIGYYFWASMCTAHASETGKVDASVPTGNFGNIYAAHVARQMGAPIDRLVLATNENDVLHEFFQTGVYAPREDRTVTTSPSMDITEASNFERFVFDLYDGDPDMVVSLWHELGKEGRFDLSGDMPLIAQGGIVSECVDTASCHGTIRGIYGKEHVLIDPHTAVAFAAAVSRKRPGIPMLVMETAQPCKFSETIEPIIGKPAPRPPAFDGIEDRDQFVTYMDPDPDQLKAFVREHA